ncbi:glycoprotease family-domain-containing protein [Aspergillus pseudodeflectus]|uniref:N(6)-L-threonylcarbamoyladenine synthase n=1 Tax=Aspergillus pseudodeflectus TaxID=176178 RepID=A0ABR4L5A6_9EURO
MLPSRGLTAVYRNGLRSKARLGNFAARRGLLTLAIESSCDDTSVAIVSKQPSGAAKIHFMENITTDSTAYQGIHPIRALESHQENLAKLVQKALFHLPPASASESQPEITIDKVVALSDGIRQKPDFISATRGPGMRSNLFTGLDTAKGLSVAWQIPFVGVHHMQAHLLTPRLIYATALPEAPQSSSFAMKPEHPSFPFISILASGGHTLLVASSSLTEHTVLATATDTAVGESLDKAARLILPSSFLARAKTTMYGKLLEEFAFPNGSEDYADYTAPATRGDEIARGKVVTESGWSLTIPYSQTRELAFSFAFLPTAIKDILAGKGEWWGDETEITEDERRLLARESMRVCFEHLASRTIIALEKFCTPEPFNTPTYPMSRTSRAKLKPKPVPAHLPVKTLVVSGGVAANSFLMKVLRSFLDARGFNQVEIVAPPPALCTDNAAMIGWAGIEMFEAGWRSELSVRALRKWSLGSGQAGGGEDQAGEDQAGEEGSGGVLGVGGWVNVNSSG